jgi:arylsulfatase A-like enzyme
MNLKEAEITLLSGICILSGSCISEHGRRDPVKKPNIVLLLADDLRWNSLNCMGNTMLHTPHIDELAYNGIRFTHGCVTTSISMVSRATILTGQYMSRHKITEFGISLTEEAFTGTYPSILRKAGYWTGFVGKYGVGQIRETDFDFAREYERVHWFPLESGDSVHVTHRNEKDALEFLRNRPKEKPFLLSVSFFATHAQDNHPDQYRYQPESEKYYQDDNIPVPETASDEFYKRLPPFIASESNEGRIRWRWRFDTPEKYQEYMKAYYRMLTELDQAVGSIVSELRNQGVFENTLIVFMGDNGYFHGEHGLSDKWYPYEESLRVPLIVYDPRLKPKERNKQIDEFVLNIDIAPAIISAAGQEIPESVQGRDFSELYLSGKNKNWRQDFYYEHPFVTSEKRIPSSEALVNHTGKYIFWPYYRYEEYFNLKADPFEKNNLMDQPDYQDMIRDMKIRFAELKEKAK